MKTVVVASIVSLLLGLGIGWYLGQRYGEKKTQGEFGQAKDWVVKFLNTEGEKVVQAIGAMESGDNKRAVELLAEPVASYYKWNSGRKDEGSKALVARIEQLAKTHPAIANAVNEAKRELERRVRWE